MFDSLSTAQNRRDWPAALLWAERLAPRHPRASPVLLARASAWSNYGIDQRPYRVHPRPALRTCLERIACQIRAIELADSAAMFARDVVEWTEAVQRLGQLQEIQGSPGDALVAFELIRRRRRDEPVAVLRATWLRAMIRDPIRPDTTLWDLRMRQLGLR